MNRQQLGSLLNLEENLIPRGRNNRPVTSNSLNFITIHNTDNPDVGADARAPNVIGVEPWDGHNDHLHVRFMQP